MVSGQELGRNLAGEVAKSLCHGVLEAILKPVFIHMEPITQAPYFVAGLGLFPDIGYRLIHSIVLSILVPNVQIGKNILLPRTLFLLMMKWQAGRQASLHDDSSSSSIYMTGCDKNQTGTRLSRFGRTVRVFDGRNMPSANDGAYVN